MEDHVKDAISKGAKVLLGGNRLEGNFFEPTILVDVSPDSDCMSDETFGPLAAIVKFRSEAEVLELANEPDVGLASYFYSKDQSRVWRVAEALQTGMVGVNKGIISEVS